VQEGGKHTRSDREDQVVDAAGLEELGEERGPVGLNLDAGGLDDGGDLLRLHRRGIRNQVTESNRENERRREEIVRDNLL
jgi:hypothetical protein